MFQTKTRIVLILSVFIAVFSALALAGGLFFKGVYRDNAFVTTTWLGNDAVTLFLAVPILLAAMVLGMRGSRMATLIWLAWWIICCITTPFIYLAQPSTFSF